MKQNTFAKRYSGEWEQFESVLVSLENRHQQSPDGVGSGLVTEQNISNFPEKYRHLCHLLAIARERQYSTALVEKLNNLVVRGHQQLYKHNTNLKAVIIEFIVTGFPSTVRKEWRYCVVSAAVFLIPGLLLWGLTLLYPELVYSVFEPSQLNDFESMYDPANREIGRVRDSDTDFAMFGHYIQNNISIGFQIFAGGMLFGIGSLFFLIFNGIFFGAISGHIVNLNFTDTFFPFVVGHGSFELTAIVLSGAAGLKMGYALVYPGRYSRSQALRLAANSSIKIIYGVILMLLIAAFIEAFWSSSTLVPIYLKYVTGAALWSFVLFYFVRMGRHHAT